MVNVTVLIPAHNRPEKLRRLLNYYSRSDVKVIVSDSSTDRFPFAGDFPNVEYRYYPNALFFDKINKVLSLIDRLQ